MLVYQKTMFDHFLLHKVILSHENFGKNTLKSSFIYYYDGAQKHEGFIGFENLCSRAKT